jgi:hypothetical protein
MLPGTDSTAWRDHITRSEKSTRHCLPVLRTGSAVSATETEFAAAGASPDSLELEIADFAQLRKRHRTVSWVLAASAVGLSADGTKAIVYLEGVCNGWCGFGQYVSLVREAGGRWHAVAIAGVWDS